MLRYREQEAEFLRARIAADRRTIREAGTQLADCAEPLIPTVGPDAAAAWVREHPKRSVSAGAVLGYVAGRCIRTTNPARRASRRAQLLAYRRRLASALGSAAISLAIRSGGAWIQALRKQSEQPERQGSTNERVGDTPRAPPPSTAPA